MDSLTRPLSRCQACCNFKTGRFVRKSEFAALAKQLVRLTAVGAFTALIAACSMFGPTKIKEEPIVPPDTLYQSALGNMDAQR